VFQQRLFNALYAYVNATPPHPGRGALMRLAVRVCPEGLERVARTRAGRPREAQPGLAAGDFAAAEAPHQAAPAPLSHNKLCNLEDFAHPALLPTIRQVFQHDVGRFGPAFPWGAEFRKHWEVAMTVRAFAATGVLRPDAEILGVGAGNEPTLFWLTNFVRRVFATDLYLHQGSWAESANTTMPLDPGSSWPGAWRKRRLVVQHMNALDLQYEDNTFDAIFSSSSVEHFGTPADVRRAVEEMFRVLRPGGILSVSTEFRVEGAPPGLPGVLMWNAEELRTLFLAGLAWTPVSAWDFDLSASTRASEVDFEACCADVAWHAARHGQILLHKLAFRSYPVVLLRKGGLVWTSVHIALRKDDSGQSESEKRTHES
jgi:SAM-dependent methyltransferase